MIYIEVANSYALANAFADAKRGDYFSSDGYEMLFEIYSELGEDYELDVIEICGCYTEYRTGDEEPSFIDDYSHYLDESELRQYSGWDNQYDPEYDSKYEELVDAICDKLEEVTTVYRLRNGNVLVYCDF